MTATLGAQALAAPGLLWGAYPEREAPRPPGPLAALAKTALARALPRRDGMSRMRDFLARVGALEAGYAAPSHAALREDAALLRAQLSRDGLSEPLLARCFALVRAAALLTLGVRPFDTQLVAARVMLDNRLAEMATGEGKTLAAAVCAATAALAGMPVHVVTVNDYLVTRDAQALRPLYAALGLTVGHVVTEHDAPTRSRAYGRDITYCTARELVFDYLRDRIARGPRRSELQHGALRLAPGGEAEPPLLLRGLCMAIVDEADSVLIDEARMPLILAREVLNTLEGDYHALALELARELTPRVHFELDVAHRCASLSPAGALALEERSAALAAAWHNRAHREETVCLALAALHLYQRDHDYLVQGGEVVIVDPSTGRLAPGRVWSRGLHQLIARKEGCQATGEQVTAAQITYQRFFARYLRLGGMSGTLWEARGELSAVYGLEVVPVATRLPGRRVVLPDRATQWRVVTAQARALSSAGRAVLIGTDSVADSESLSATLREAGLAHQVLNARHDLAEARIVAAAGAPGRITVATNMAGRGTDITLDPAVAQRGGLHVISCQQNPSRRIDRQLIGRCARQGDPGSAQTLVTPDKLGMAGLFIASMARLLPENGLSHPRWLVALLVRMPQWREESRQRAQRRALQDEDQRAERELLGGIPAD